ncbi:DUF3817 domain-containing protein [Chryseobacterium limigenitum]|uniref:Integral membrane protein n=1 Tax=Chryseobacterium limigenitum TaxID=1612149 RepID=A0A1K2ILA2_9FLAO|nr:DUF3817 domain-containing protein [Chryseobacterium limigenitum]SFZ93220.1 integral membrane protein [Chryseobacterium limigenitum]
MINLYRKTAVIEGISYLILLLIAMPLKYFFNIPSAVKYFGWIHGILFLVFFVYLILASSKYRWSLIRIIIYLTASVLPFILFLIDKRLEKEYSIKGKL